MRRTLIVLSYLVVMGLGYSTALFLPSISSSRINTEWHQLPSLSGGKWTSYGSEAIFNDIPLPHVKSISGATKFVDDGAVQPSSIRFGYKVAVDVAPLDLSKVPESYKKEKPTYLGGGKKFTQQPIDQVIYEVRFVFTLKDKDGFTLTELKSEPENIESGKINSFQNFATEVVPIGITSKTATILIGMSVVKCLTCDKP